MRIAKLITPVAVFLFALQVVVAQELDTLFDLWIDIFSLEILEADFQTRMEAISRFLVWLIVFTLAHAILKERQFGGSKIKNKTAVVLAFCVAAISAIGIPNSVIVLIPIAYGGTVAWLLFSLITVGILFLTYRVINEDLANSAWLVHLIRLMLLLLLYWVASIFHGAVAPEFAFTASVEDLMATAAAWFKSIVTILVIVELFLLFSSFGGKDEEKTFLDFGGRERKKQEEEKKEEKEFLDLQREEEKVTGEAKEIVHEELHTLQQIARFLKQVEQDIEGGHVESEELHQKLQQFGRALGRLHELSEKRKAKLSKSKQVVVNEIQILNAFIQNLMTSHPKVQEQMQRMGANEKIDITRMLEQVDGETNGLITKASTDSAKLRDTFIPSLEREAELHKHLNLNRLNEQLQAALQTDDIEQYHQHIGQMLEIIRPMGAALTEIRELIEKREGIAEDLKDDLDDVVKEHEELMRQFEKIIRHFKESSSD